MDIHIYTLTNIHSHIHIYIHFQIYTHTYIYTYKYTHTHTHTYIYTGGGTADRKIKFWNTTTGKCLNSIDTNSQVCSLLWNKQHKEIISSHGFSQNQLCIWKYPTMNKVAELTGHTSRVLHMAMSPDGETVVSAAGDETLRFWKCFANDSKVKSSGGMSNNQHGINTKKNRPSINHRMIR